MSKNTSTSNSKKAPVFDHENFTFWSTLFQAHVGKAEWSLFETPEPEVNADDYADTLDENGERTDETRILLKLVEKDHYKWEKNQNKIHQQLVESCSDTKSLRLQTIEYINLPGIEFYRSLEKRYLDTSSSQLTFHVGIYIPYNGIYVAVKEL